MTPELRAKLERVKNLPSPPAVAAQVIDLAEKPNVHLAQVAQAISCDASLAAKIMRVANSAMYARRRSSTNLRQALVVLGLHATVTLALGFSLLPLLKRSAEENKLLSHTWRRSLMSGICARAVGNVSTRFNAEEAFLSALLQDVGIMGLDRVFPGFYDGASEFIEDHEALIKFEHGKLEADHAQVGAWLLRQWNLPEYLQDAVAVSHRLHGTRAADSSQHLSRCVAMSGLLADIWLDGCKDHAAVRKIARVAVKELEISSEDFNRIMQEVGDSAPEMAHVFDTELIDSDDARDITERAHEILTERSLQSLQEADNANEKAAQLESYAQDLEIETQRDALTEIASRAYLQELLDKGFDQAQRFSWPLGVMFVDLDHFKAVNDTYGHAAGDEVLRGVSKVLSNAIRTSDTVGRYGGEEFLIILPGADREGIEVVADRILGALRTCKHNVGNDRHISVTASIGCALVGEGLTYDSAASFVACADEALYSAKAEGRDRLKIYAPAAPSDAPAAAASGMRAASA